MDPATIASASVAASKALYSISTSLYTYIHSAKQVDKSLQRLHDEVQSLERVLKAVGTLLERPAFSEHSAAAEMMQGMWSPIRHAGPNEAKGALKKAWKQVKLNLSSEDIKSIRSRLQTHSTSLQIALAAANLCSNTNETSLITSLQRKIDDLNSQVLLAIESNLPKGFENHEIVDHAKALTESALAVTEAASVIAATNSTISCTEYTPSTSSVEQSLPFHVCPDINENIENWPPSVNTEKETNESKSSAAFDNPFRTVAVEERSTREMSDTESDSEIEIEVAYACFRNGIREFDSHLYNEALASLSTGLTRVNALAFDQRARFFLQKYQLKQAMCLLHVGRPSDAQQIFQSLVDGSTKTKGSAECALIASLGLTQTFLCDERFSEAVKCCLQSIKGCRRVFGKNHPLYTSSLRLMSLTYELSGDTPNTNAFNDLANETSITTDGPSESESIPTFNIQQMRELIAKEADRRMLRTVSEGNALLQTLGFDPRADGFSIDDSFSALLKMEVDRGTRRTSVMVLAAQFLVDRGAKIQAGALHEICKTGNVALARLLCDYGADLKFLAGDKTWNTYWTALHTAARYGRIDIMKLFIERGAPVDCHASRRPWDKLAYHEMELPVLDSRRVYEGKRRLYEGETPLVWACRFGKKPAVEYLLDAGANIDFILRGRTLVTTAVDGYHDAVLDTLIARKADIHRGNPLFRALSDRNKHAILVLIEGGVDIKERIKDSNGGTVIAFAVLYSSSWRSAMSERGKKEASSYGEVAELLCSKGAEVPQVGTFENWKKKGVYLDPEGKDFDEIIEVVKRYHSGKRR